MACAVVAIGGFSLTYLGPLAVGTFNGPALLHLHGLLSFAWMLLFVSQAAFISSSRADLHRTAGMFGIALATAMVFTVMAAGLKGLQTGIEAGYPYESRAVFYVTFSQIALFVVMIVGAITCRTLLISPWLLHCSPTCS